MSLVDISGDGNGTPPTKSTPNPLNFVNVFVN